MRLLLIVSLLTLVTAQVDVTTIPPSAIAPLMHIAAELGKVDSECFKGIKSWIKDLMESASILSKAKGLSFLQDERLRNLSYALTQLSAFGHPATVNVDEMSLNWAGDHNLCYKVNAPRYKPQYCVAHINVLWREIDFKGMGIDLPFDKLPEMRVGEGRCATMATSSIKIGVCLPESCKHDQDIARIMSNMTNDIARLCDISCVGPAKEKNWFFWTVNVIILTLTTLTITSAATAFAYSQTTKSQNDNSKGGLGWKLFMTFDFFKNTKEIFTLKNRPDTILCIDSIRFITFTWVVVGHVFVFMADSQNALRLLKQPDYFFADIFGNPYSAVDTFFVISGLLGSYVFFKKAIIRPEYVSDTWQWALYYIHRWLRLTPAYMLFIAFYIAWTPQMHDFWSTQAGQNFTKMAENCERTWWMNALYINNFDNVLSACYPISWYLAVDTQLYFIAPLFLLAFAYSAKAGLVASGLGLLCSIGSSVYLTFYLDLPALDSTVKHPGVTKFFQELYVKPWVRSAPYFIGLAAGYFFAQVLHNNIKRINLKKYQIALLWLISTTLALVTIFVVYDYLRGEVEWDKPTRAAYNGLARIAWSSAVLWVIIACNFDYGGPVKTILEHPIWYPLGRLSYCAYLVHWVIIHYVLNQRDTPIYFVSIWDTYYTLVIPIVFLSYILALFWSCTVEIPFCKMENIIVGIITEKFKKKKTPSYYGSKIAPIVEVKKEIENEKNGATIISVGPQY